MDARLVLVLFATAWNSVFGLECPRPEAARSEGGGQPASFDIENASPVDVIAVWVDRSGAEVSVGVVAPHSTRTEHSFNGHVFRYYSADGPRVLLKELTVGDHLRSEPLRIDACGTVAQLVDFKAKPRSFHPLGKSPIAPQSRDASALRRGTSLDCPSPTKGARSGGNGEKTTLNIENLSPVDVTIKWVDFAGNELKIGTVMSKRTTSAETSEGHVFRCYHADDPTILLDELVVSADLPNPFRIYACGNLALRTDNDASFKRPVHDSRERAEAPGSYVDASNHSGAMECPTPTEGARSRNGGKHRLITVQNALPVNVTIKWVDFSGNEKHGGLITAHGTRVAQTFNGFVFRFYHGDDNATLLHEMVVGDDLRAAAFRIHACGDLAQRLDHDALDGGAAVECPKPTQGVRSVGNDRPITVKLKNTSPLDVVVRWVDSTGQEVSTGYVMPNDTRIEHTFYGHVIRYYLADDPSVLLHELFVGEDLRSKLFNIRPCGELTKQPRGGSARNDEFQKLMHDQNAPCEPQGGSEKWSCIRRTKKAELDVERRLPLWGFKDEAESQYRHVGEIDDGHQISPLMPRITTGPGYMKMNMTNRMKEIVLFWFHQRVKEEAAFIREGIIEGGYTNNHVVTTQLVPINDPNVDRMIVDEMKQVLEWWTQQRLEHTRTFGVRIYSRESMMLHHMDHLKTHIASVVLQLAQDVDKDGGWPLEIIRDNGDSAQIFLQPGEMVLYEGARFKHGRPMRFRGNSFANIFCHFKPVGWHGPVVS